MKALKLGKQARHIGIIMDGNGRWAQQRLRPRTFGHIKGARTAKKIITAARELGIENLTLYAFSTENWLRPNSEVQFLLSLLGRYLKREINNLLDQNIRFLTIGDLNRLPKDLAAICKNTVQATEKCTGMNLVFAISYGSRSELTEAARELAKKVALGELDPQDIDEALLAAHLNTYPIPDVDLVIRTSGEQRLSNFMLWQCAYSELFFTDTLWPDFNKQELIQILNEFIGRDRRFGGVKSENEHIRN